MPAQIVLYLKDNVTYQQASDFAAHLEAHFPAVERADAHPEEIVPRSPRNERNHI